MSNPLPIELDDWKSFNFEAFPDQGLQYMNELVDNLDLDLDLVYDNCRRKLRAMETDGNSYYTTLLEYLNILEEPVIPSRTDFKEDKSPDQALNQGAFSAFDSPFLSNITRSRDTGSWNKKIERSRSRDLATETEVAKWLKTPEILTPGKVRQRNFDRYLGVSAVHQSRNQVSRDCEGLKPSAGLQSVVEEHLEGFGEVVQQKSSGQPRKRRLCRHFRKGFCARGQFCDFFHDPSIFCSDKQKVFIGGLPLHLTSQNLKRKLEELGFTVLNEPRVLRGFTPEVCLGSEEEVERLIAQRYIVLDNQLVDVDVQQYRDKGYLEQVLPSFVKRSVILRGLKENTTAEMIVKDIQKLDVEVVEDPVVKNGSATRVVLGSVDGAKMMVSLGRVLVNGTIVDVRPDVRK